MNDNTVQPGDWIMYLGQIGQVVEILGDENEPHPYLTNMNFRFPRASSKLVMPMVSTPTMEDIANYQAQMSNLMKTPTTTQPQPLLSAIMGALGGTSKPK